ncbi:MAG: hypothetical protein KAT16_03670 [Candidatus Heimdallarchaeota archaeon]|nr:hypothetical protein [Candidatus Heimdallarchaeota archaeon]
MMRNKIIAIIALVLILGNIAPVLVSQAATTNNRVTFYGNFYQQVTRIEYNFLHPLGALQDTKSSSVISSMTNSLAASIIFDEYSKGGSAELLSIAQGIVEISSRYFGEAFTSDNRGWLSYYDFEKDTDSVIKERKFTHDSFLMLLALANSYLSLEEEDVRGPDYLAFANETEEFIQEYMLEDDFKWIDNLFIFNQTLYTKNRFILVEHVCWTIWASLNLPASFNSPLALDSILQMVEFLAENATSNGAIFNILSPEGESSDKVFKLRTNALYGIINLILHEKIGDAKYLNRGKAVFDYLTDILWDKGFKGFFDQSDETGLLIVQGKSLGGNTMACLLASKLLRYYPNDDTIKSIYVLVDQFIEKYLTSSLNSLYHVSCNRDGSNKLNIISLESNLMRLWQRSNSLHLVIGNSFQQVSIGEKVVLDLSVSNPDNISYTVFVNGKHIESINQTTSESQLTLEIPLKNNAVIGYSTYDVEIRVSNVKIDGSENIQLQIGSDRRLPPGLVYFVAIGILGVLVVLARYPPKNIEEFLNQISSIGLSSDVEQDEAKIITKNDEKIPESEE